MQASGFDGEIRGLVPSDLDALVDLVDQSMEPAHGGRWSRRGLEAALAAPTARTMLARVAGSEGTPVGFLVARQLGPLLEIDLVGVLPEHRRAGVASALMGAALDAARAEATNEVQLELAESNAAARAFYAGFGFVVVGERARYYPDGESALLLSRAL